MEKFICKVEKTGGSHRLVIPYKIMRLQRWHDVLYVVVEYKDDDTLSIRRLIDEKALEEDN